MILIAAGLFVLGLCAGSFVNALVWRVREQSKRPGHRKNLSVLTGRSICPHCNHLLAAKDLVPVLSWLALHGRCRYCAGSISRQYPLVELWAGLVFALSYIFWPADLSSNGGLVLFIIWLLTSIGLLALLVYDYRWMLLPNRILYPTALVAAAGRLIYVIGFEADKADALLQWGLGVLIAAGIFWLIFIVSRGKWIGYGDVRLGIITGTVLASPTKSLLMIFTASLLGTLYVIPTLISKKQSMASHVPFGPFLILATFLVLLVGQSFIDWYRSLL